MLSDSTWKSVSLILYYTRLPAFVCTYNSSKRMLYLNSHKRRCIFKIYSALVVIYDASTVFVNTLQPRNNPNTNHNQQTFGIFLSAFITTIGFLFITFLHFYGGISQEVFSVFNCLSGFVKKGILSYINLNHYYHES